jgi:hypothetical protein
MAAPMMRREIWSSLSISCIFFHRRDAEDAEKSEFLFGSCGLDREFDCSVLMHREQQVLRFAQDDKSYVSSVISASWR